MRLLPSRRFMPQLVINKVEWESFLGETLDSTYLLTSLVTADKGRATFRAEAPKAPTQVLVPVADAEGVNAEAVRRRYLEASYLRHENILSVVRVARKESHGRSLVLRLFNKLRTALRFRSKKYAG